MIARSHHFTLSILLTFGLLVALCLTPSAAGAEMGATEEDHHLLGDDPYRRQNRGGTVRQYGDRHRGNPGQSRWEHGRSERLDRFSHTNFGSIVNTGLPQGCELMTTRPLARPRLPSPNRARTSTSCGVRASTRSCPRC